MKVFEIIENKVETGSLPVMIAGLKSNYPAIVIGEEGRGRKLGLIPIVGARMVPCPNNGKSSGYSQSRATMRDPWRCEICASPKVNEVHPEGWYAPDRVMNVLLDKSKSGRHIFRVAPEEEQPGNAVVVLRTPIGFRGGNRHQDIYGGQFPLDILMDGTIAQGDAGAMGSGKQFIALVKPGQSWRVVITGRRYGKPNEYYYHYDGHNIYVSVDLNQFIDEGIIDEPTKEEGNETKVAGSSSQDSEKTMG